MTKQARSTEQPELAFSGKPPAKKGGRSPEELAQAAVARMPTTVSGHRVKLMPTLFVTREVADRGPRDPRGEEHSRCDRGHPRSRESPEVRPRETSVYDAAGRRGPHPCMMRSAA